MKHIEQPTYNGGTEIQIIRTEIEHQQALLANDLMRHLAIVAAMPHGEDSTGRQQLRLMTPAEVVERATTIADLAWKNYRERGWLLDVPEPKPMKRQLPEAP